jgi:DNA-binding MarR family transcriptional regulator
MSSTTPTERYTAERILELMHANWPESCSPASELMVRLHRVRDLFYDAFCQVLTPYGLSAAEFDVLATLRSVPPPYELTPTELYDAVLLSSGGMTKVLKHLEERKLVTRVANPLDGRSKRVRLTLKGKTLAEESMQSSLANDRALLSRGLSQREISRLTDLVGKLLRTIEPVNAKVSTPQGEGPNGYGTF